MWQDREKAQEEAALDVWIPQRTNERLAEENPGRPPSRRGQGVTSRGVACGSIISHDVIL